MTRPATDPAIAAQPFAADVPPLPADYARCADASLCPFMATCARAEPPPNEWLVSYSLFNAHRMAEGGETCEHFIDREG